MKTLLLATRNQNKVTELHALLADMDVDALVAKAREWRARIAQVRSA